MQMRSFLVDFVKIKFKVPKFEIEGVCEHNFF